MYPPWFRPFRPVPARSSRQHRPGISPRHHAPFDPIIIKCLACHLLRRRSRRSPLPAAPTSSSPRRPCRRSDARLTWQRQRRSCKGRALWISAWTTPASAPKSIAWVPYLPRVWRFILPPNNTTRELAWEADPGDSLSFPGAVGRRKKGSRGVDIMRSYEMLRCIERFAELAAGLIWLASDP